MAADSYACSFPQQQLLTCTLLSVSQPSAENQGTEVTDYGFSLGSETPASERGNWWTCEAWLCFPWTSRGCAPAAWCVPIGIRHKALLTGVPWEFLFTSDYVPERFQGFLSPLHQMPACHDSPRFPTMLSSLHDWEPDWEPLWGTDTNKNYLLISPLRHLTLLSACT